MRHLIGLTGLSLACGAAGTYCQGLIKGLCIGLFVFGVGLLLGAFKK